MFSVGLPIGPLAAVVIILIINAKLRGLGKKSIVAPPEQAGTGLESQV